MFLKVDNDGAEQIYSFKNQDVVVIGRAPSSDIQLVTDGISRKHLEVREKDGEFFVIDFGSTNGTFQNDERLEANVEHPFNSFFPLKLGFHVYLSLVDEISPEQLSSAITDIASDDAEKKRREEQRAARSQKIKASNTGKINVGEKTATNTKISRGETSSSAGRKRTSRRIKETKEENKGLNMPLYFAVFALVLGGVAYYQGYFDSLFTPDTSKIVKLKPRKKKKRVKKKIKAKPTKLSVDDMRSKISYDKCLGKKEIPFCDRFKTMYKRSYTEGFVVIVNDIFFNVSYEKLVEDIRSKIEVDDNDRNTIMSSAKDSQGRNFNKNELIDKKYQLFYDSKDMNTLSVFLYMYTTLNFQELMDQNNIEKFYFVGMTRDNTVDPWFDIEVNRGQLAALVGDKELQKALRLTLFSGITRMTEDALKKNHSQLFNQLKKSVRYFY